MPLAVVFAQWGPSNKLKRLIPLFWEGKKIGRSVTDYILASQSPKETLRMFVFIGGVHIQC